MEVPNLLALPGPAGRARLVPDRPQTADPVGRERAPGNAALGPASAWHTVKRFSDAAEPEDLFTGQWQNRPSLLDNYKPYLDDRWNEGFTNAWKPWEEIVPLGYKGSYQRVRAYLREGARHHGR